PRDPRDRAGRIRRSGLLRRAGVGRRLAGHLAVFRHRHDAERARLDAGERGSGTMDDGPARRLRQGTLGRLFFTTEEVMTHTQKRSAIWTVAITSVALFMVSLDNLVVTTALPVIRHELNASISQLEWTVNAYTLTFAVLLLTGAALGDRFGRRRMFVLGLLLFTGASAAAALSTSANALDI